MTLDLDQLARQQINALDAARRIVVIHPYFTGQHTLLNLFMSQPGAVYLRLDGRRLTYADLKPALDAALAEAVSAGGGARTLILDEVDRAGADALDRLLPHALDVLGFPRVVLFGREIAAPTLNNPALFAQAAFVPASAELLLTDYAARQPGETLLEVRVLGNGGVMVNGRAITQWDGLLPRALFFYLVDRGLATRNDIFASFWPKLSPREATNVFHVTKRKINEMLGIDLTIYYSGFYRVSPEIRVTYDLTLFSELFQQSEVAAPAEAEALLTRALALYRGPFLANVRMDWAARRRGELIEIYADALCALAALYENQGRTVEALGLYARALNPGQRAETIRGHVERLTKKLGLRASEAPPPADIAPATAVSTPALLTEVRVPARRAAKPRQTQPLPPAV
jgi:hypothetical protein